MAKKKITGKSRAGKKPSKAEANLSGNLLKTVAAVFLLLFLVVAAGFFFQKYYPLSTFRQPESSESTASKYRHLKAAPPAYEIFPKQERIPPADRAIRKSPPGGLPRVAIIIDDFGYDIDIARKFSELNAEITFAILPYSPQGKKIAQIAKAKNLEIMLHLPLEPSEYPRVNPGPGVLLSSMSPDALIEQLTKDLDFIPHIRGVNNHMGSEITTISTKMYQIFSILKKRDLFFVDSKTSSDSLCKPSARLLKLPFGERDVFLDHAVDSDSIRKQIRTLLRIAQRQGEAIGIGHPHKTTYQVLREKLPEIKAEVQLVKASSIVEIMGE